jgi:hypothetical protein
VSDIQQHKIRKPTTTVNQVSLIKIQSPLPAKYKDRNSRLSTCLISLPIPLFATRCVVTFTLLLPSLLLFHSWCKLVQTINTLP